MIAGTAVRTPLVRLHVEDAPAEIYLKLENLQPIGSFKIRGAYNAMSAAPPEELAARRAARRAPATWRRASAGPRGSWASRARSIVPDHAPQTKLDAIERLGGTYVKVPFERWWQALEERSYPGVEGFFVHPVEDEPVMAGNGTIGLEILEDLPDVDTVIVPWGGGGLFTGIASAVKALRPETSMRVVELETVGAAHGLPGRRRAARDRLQAELRRRRRGAVPCSRRCGGSGGRSSTARSS